MGVKRIISDGPQVNKDWETPNNTPTIIDIKNLNTRKFRSFIPPPLCREIDSEVEVSLTLKIYDCLFLKVLTRPPLRKRSMEKKWQETPWQSHTDLSLNVLMATLNKMLQLLRCYIRYDSSHLKDSLSSWEMF